MTVVRNECSATFSEPVPKNWYPVLGVLRNMPHSFKKSTILVVLPRFFISAMWCPRPHPLLFPNFLWPPAAGRGDGSVYYLEYS